MKITLADYLAKRLSQLGITDVFGLPGDFNFNILYAIEDCNNLNWVNCTNELNAGYAADGYARVNGFGAVVTTYGVGELSAINAIAGSYSESVPVMKIAGVPRTDMIKNKAILHHNFQKPDYYAFERAYSNVVETTAYLDEDNAKAELDRIFEVMVKTRKPVYVAIPVDICKMEIDDFIPEIEMVSDAENLEKAVNHIFSVISDSETPVIMADFPIKRFKLQNELANLIEKTQIPSTTLMMGKGSIDETNNCFIGTNMGNVSAEITQSIMSKSDCVITFGALYADLNTGGFSVMPDESFKIDIQSDYCVVESARYNNVWMKDIIEKLTERLPQKSKPVNAEFGYQLSAVEEEQPLTTSHIFESLQEFLKEDDMIFVETGIITFPSGLIKLPKNVLFNTQSLWGSIGWATPAMFGGAMADRSRRPILFTGEGSHQLTMQEVANMMHYDIKPVVFILNNDGYTVERALSDDPMDKFNDITSWNYSKLPELFNGDYCSFQVRSNQELKDVMLKIEQEQKNRMCYVELFTDKMDIPEISNTIISNIRNAVSQNKFLVNQI